MGSVPGGFPYITDSDGDPNMFNLNRNDDGLWLNANYANPDNRWNPGKRWLLVRRDRLHFSLDL
ncbi:MAG: hypothetical protein U9Q03_05730 [Patescibacteria group bacterium]|nr:hypothetical protein [Patescibacteria group bacterium]